MKSELGDKIRILHILDAITEIEDYLKGVDYQLYLENSEKRFATIKQIEIIGKASIALIDELKEKHSEIPWKLIRGFRNISVHEYFGVDFRLGDCNLRFTSAEITNHGNQSWI